MEQIDALQHPKCLQLPKSGARHLCGLSLWKFDSNEEEDIIEDITKSSLIHSMISQLSLVSCQVVVVHRKVGA